jgi:hypothetical protein
VTARVSGAGWLLSGSECRQGNEGGVAHTGGDPITPLDLVQKVVLWSEEGVVGQQRLFLSQDGDQGPTGAVGEAFEQSYRMSAPDGPVGSAGGTLGRQWFGSGFVASIRSREASATEDPSSPILW